MMISKSLDDQLLEVKIMKKKIENQIDANPIFIKKLKIKGKKLFFITGYS